MKCKERAKYLFVPFAIKFGRFCQKELKDSFIFLHVFTGVQYAESVLNFSRNCDYAMYVVDHLLDILTGNEHRKTSKYIEEMKNLRKGKALLMT